MRLSRRMKSRTPTGPKLGLSRRIGQKVSVLSDDPIYISPWFYDSVIQGTHEIFLSEGLARNAVYLNAPPADGDGLQYKMYMSAGTYTCKALVQKFTTRPIVKVKIDGVTVATWDLYGSLQQNYIFTEAGIVVSSSGVKTIQFVADGKNPSSGNYQYAFSELVFYRTA